MKAFENNAHTEKRVRFKEQKKNKKRFVVCESKNEAAREKKLNLKS